MSGGERNLTPCRTVAVRCWLGSRWGSRAETAAAPASATSRATSCTSETASSATETTAPAETWAGGAITRWDLLSGD